MKILLSSLLFLSFVCFSIGAVAQIKAVSFQSGTYINLCGTGTQATANTCNRGCDPAKGRCSASNNQVVKFICDGRVAECRSNESSFASSQSIGNPGCGKTVQIDVFSKNCRANGGWDCQNSDLLDYMVWYSGDCSSPGAPQTAQTCRQQQPMTVLFKRPTETKWVSGANFTASGIKTGEEFEVNCFAQNGTALLNGGEIELTPPEGQTSVISTTPELRNYRSFQTGTHIFRCSSSSIANCSKSDSVVIRAASVEQAANQQPTIFQRLLPRRAQPASSANPTPVVSPSPSPSPSPAPTHRSQCDDLEVISGNDSLVPATVRLRAQGSDNLGSIQKYRFYFGDGQQTETDNPEIDHRYESSGKFTARVDIKDSKGNWKTSSACETTVRIKALPVESHKSNCADITVTADNNGRAPSLVKVKVNGFDNKGNLQQYRVDFGNGVVQESDQQTQEYRYETAGTFVVRGYVKDSQGNWRGGNENCRKTLYISTEPLTKQPETGTPTLFTLVGLVSGASGLSLQWWRKRQLH